MSKEWIWVMVGISVVILTSLFQVSVYAETAKGQEMELNTNRPGNDYKDLDLSEADPTLCRDACQKEKRCKAWTYVKPGIQADNARCWLKSPIPAAVPDENCVSGLKGK
jgi:hypothetical protein